MRIYESQTHKEQEDGEKRVMRWLKVYTLLIC